MGNRKNDEEENGVLDTIGEAASAVGKFLFKGGRDFSEKGLKELAKEKVKQPTKKVKKDSTAKPTKPKNSSIKKQTSASPSGTSFFDMKEADLRKQRIAQRLARIKQLQEENK